MTCRCPLPRLPRRAICRRTSPAQPTADGTQRELVERAAEVGRTRLAPHAARHDREASFPFDNFDDLRQAGLLALCVPRSHGGLDADFATYALVVAELGRHCAATALSFNMHASACMGAGFIADLLDMSPAQRADHERHRALHFERIVSEGKLYAQPFSEGGAAAAGKAPWSTLARKVDGGYRINGRKIFASLSGAADYYGVLCTLDRPGRPRCATRCTWRCRATHRA